MLWLIGKGKRKGSLGYHYFFTVASALFWSYFLAILVVAYGSSWPQWLITIQILCSFLILVVPFRKMSGIRLAIVNTVAFVLFYTFKVYIEMAASS